MSRLPALTPEEMSEAQRRVYEEFQSVHAEVAITHLTWLRSPELASHIAKFGPFLRYKCLDARKRELAILITGRYCRAPAEWDAHLPPAREAGIEEEIIGALAEKRRPDFTRPEEETLYEFAMELLEDYSVSEATYRQAMDRLGAEKVVELVAIVGFYVMLAMLIGAFQFQLPEGVEPAFTD